MMMHLLLILVTLQPHLQSERELAELAALRQQLGRVAEILERLVRNQEQREEQKPVCLAEIQLLNGTVPKRFVPKPAGVASLNFFSTVSKPSDGCLPAEVRVSASYLDANDDLICSGWIENVAIQNSLMQRIYLEIRPWNLGEFARWRNEPPQTNSGLKRLVCFNAEGVVEVNPTELERTARIKVRATILPQGGGVSTAEVELTPQR